MKPIILIIDDEPVILSTITKILSPDFQVRATKDGTRAMEIASTQPIPDLILLDVMMPDIDGYNVLKALKADAVTKDIPVIFVTAMGSESNEEKGLALGAADYIAKPISPAILLARVKNQLILKKAKDFLIDKNTFLESEIKRRMLQNIIAQDVSIRALAHLAETRDPETGHHLLRTQSYVNILSKGLKENPKYSKVMTDEYIDLLTKSAPLHDIGKVGIPDFVLLKPGKLTPEEFEIMKSHSILGSQAIEAAEKDVAEEVDFLKLAKEIAHWHHERWDGMGYPDGLKGEQIPLSARVMAVADVFDALISKRVYKEEFSLKKAKQIMINESEGHFDPDILSVFVKYFTGFETIAIKYAN